MPWFCVRVVENLVGCRRTFKLLDYIEKTCKAKVPTKVEFLCSYYGLS